MSATPWTEQSVGSPSWINDVFGPGWTGDYIVIGGGMLPVDADGTVVASAATSSVAWAEGSQNSTAWAEASGVASGFTEVSG